MNEIYTLELTEEELIELQRTLIGRLDIDLDNVVKSAMKAQKLSRVIEINRLIEINKQILNKVNNLSRNIDDGWCL